MKDRFLGSVLISVFFGIIFFAGACSGSDDTSLWPDSDCPTTSLGGGGSASSASSSSTSASSSSSSSSSSSGAMCDPDEKIGTSCAPYLEGDTMSCNGTKITCHCDDWVPTDQAGTSCPVASGGNGGAGGSSSSSGGGNGGAGGTIPNPCFLGEACFPDDGTCIDDSGLYIRCCEGVLIPDTGPCSGGSGGAGGSTGGNFPVPR